MAEKYRAKTNNLNEEIPEKTEKEKRQESATKVSKVAAKGAAEYFAPGVGGKLVDMASKTKAGQQILNRAGKTLAQNPIASQLMKKADDRGLVDGADKAVDMLSKNPEGLKGNTKNALNSNNGLEKKDSLNSSENSSNESGGFNLFNKKDKKNNSFFGSAFGSGEINLFKLIGKKYLIITACSCFGFLLLLTVVVSAKDFANLDLTNGDTSMTSTGSTIQNNNFGSVGPVAGVTYYYQYNYSQSYGYGTTISSSGCGPTSMAMVLSSLLNKNISPIDTADYSLSNGHRVKNQGTAWSFFPAISKEYGINCEVLTLSKDSIVNSLSSNKFMIISLGPGHFTNNGHFIVLTGINSDGKITVADPNSEQRTKQLWDIDVFLDEGKGGLWAFSI